MPQQWEVFLIPNCRHTKPLPKSKFVIIVYTDPKPHGFFINSGIRRFIRKRPEILNCEAPISAENNPSFLQYDGYVDCTSAYEYSLSELTKSMGCYTQLLNN